MIKKIAGILLVSVASLSAFGQTTEVKKTTARPDIPGTFTLEIGLNRAMNAPDNFSTGLWGSRTINLYYQYEFQILKSRFSFVPGIGLSLERFKFKDGHILNYLREDNDVFGNITSFDSVKLYNPTEHGITGLKKSQLVMNFVELPLELRYTLNPDDPARSFKISIGGRVGYLYDSFNKIKYSQGGEVKTIKDKQYFNLNRFRYGVFTKIGFGSFSFFGYYNLSPMFQNHQGLTVDETNYNDMNTFTAGISLSSF